MARTSIPTYVTGTLITAAHGNTYWRDNETAHWSKLVRKTYHFRVVPYDTALTTGDGKNYFLIPAEINGANLVDADCSLGVVSSSGLPTVQIRRVRSGTPADVLSTLITIDVSEYSSFTAATAPVINTSNDDVATGDLYYFDVDGAGTGVYGLDAILVFEQQS